MTNTERIVKKVNELGYNLGTCFDFEQLNKANTNKIIEALDCHDSCDCPIFINRKSYIVEIWWEADYEKTEIDFNLLTKREYEERYGDK